MKFIRAVFLSLFLVLILSGTSNAQKSKLKKDYVITITTEYGEMVVLLYEQTPQHKKNFIKLAKEGFYDSTTFHRVIDDFMIQGGDPNSKDNNPNNDGLGGPKYTIPAEFVGLKHVRGALAAARMGDNVNPNRESSGSQFYIVENHNGTPHLDNAYTVFGQVIKGLDVIDKIAVQKCGPGNRPIKDIKMSIKVENVKVKKIIKDYNCASFYQ